MKNKITRIVVLFGLCSFVVSLVGYAINMTKDALANSEYHMAFMLILLFASAVVSIAMVIYAMIKTHFKKK